ncbi:acetoacetate-CoA ligase [Neoconidiobolus thromboides FSU 785]|nr:acetoacetate-CoA ligase [Neoconidiobolus thromboides FSU 785]
MMVSTKKLGYDIKSPQLMWEPKDLASHNMEKFRVWVNQKHGLKLENYNQLYEWSCDKISDFWADIWEYTHVISSKPWTQVVDENQPMNEIPTWFEGSRLNFAENLLWCRDPNKVAIYGAGELREVSSLSYAQLYEKVRQVASALKKLGITVGDRVAGYLPNCPETIIFMLAVTSLGAIWSSTSPDFGTNGVLDRFSQIEPKVLFSVNAIVYNGKVHDHLNKVESVVSGLNSLKKVVVFPFVESHSMDLSKIANSVILNDFISPQDDEPLTFEQLPFNHPLYILFSSGTTGKPKCLVHTAGGMLLQHKKEHIIHGNMSEKDIFFQYTTTGWMMWNWLVSGLSVGASIVLYDGSPFKPSPNVLFELVDKLRITIFGTSAKYIQSLQEAKVKPNETFQLTSLHSLYSTGSPLKPENYDYVYKYISKDLCLGSITGGTDICSLFAGHSTALPVYRGEIQCRCLGMKIESWDEKGVHGEDRSGDLVCTKAFPAMPVKFWNDEGNAKYTAAYFEQFKGIWYHGDFVLINSKTGGVFMLGRSDGTLNPAGVRFGSAEIYNCIEDFTELEDSLVVGQKFGDDERVVLFLKLKQGQKFTQELINNLRLRIRTLLSPRHVPAIILAVPDIPYTVNGKKVEVAVKKLINGTPIESISTATLANPECLKYYLDIAELKIPELKL